MDASGQPMDINSILGNFVDRGVWPYYDIPYAALTAGSVTLPTQVTLFATPVGTSDPVTNLTKTRVQTNMISAGSQYGFGATRCLILEAIGFGFPSYLQKANVDQILGTSYMQFQIAEKIFYEGRLELWPGGFGLMGVSTQTGEESWTLGLPVPEAMRRFNLEYGKYIAPTIPFNLTVYFPNAPTIAVAGTAATIPGALTNPTSSAICVPYLFALLDGLTDRAVQ